MGAPQYEQAGADIGGTGTTNTIPRWTGPSTLGDSVITQNSTALVTTGSSSATQTTFRVRTVGTANNAPVFSLYREGVNEQVIWAGSGTIRFGFATDPAGYTDAQLLTATKMGIDASGNVGIGTAGPLARLHSFISGAAPLVAAGGDTISGSVVEGPNTALASGSGSLQPFAVLTNDTQAVDRGGGILFGGKWTNANNSFAYFGGVKAGKENSTSAEYGGYLAFYSRTNGATGLAERARIDSAGNLLVRQRSNAANNAVAFDNTVQNALTVDSGGNIYGTSGTTGMTNGFFYIPAAAGAPTGVPTAVAGRVPMYYDTTNNQFYVYNGAWKKVTLA